MLGKIGVALSVIALGVAGLAYHRTTQPVVVQSSIPGEAIRAYLLENPEVIVEAVNVYEQRQKEKEAAADGDLITSNSDEIFNDGFSLISGNPDGDITVVEFSDYNCGFCKRAHGEMEKFVAADGNVRVVLKEFPILGASSVLAARAALASANLEGGAKYPAFNEALITHKGSHSEETVMALATKVGIDPAALAEAMKDKEIEKQIQRTYALAKTLKINGTPAFIIGDQVIRGYVPAEQLEALAKRARADG